MKPCTILEDKRKIVGVFWNDGAGSCLRVDHNHVTSIVAYGEPGQYCEIPWIAVYKDTFLFTRIPAQHVEIQYKEAPDVKS